METEMVTEHIEQLAMPLLREAKVELVDLNVHRQREIVHIQIFVDKETGGITVDECTWLNKNIYKIKTL